ncbi:MAG: phosphate ABC transporter substrate-binding protein [Acidobacteriota bacterium]|nr:phosphate ABC transporter substrate-binding protein [Acidobacteriota bacterium]
MKNHIVAIFAVPLMIALPVLAQDRDALDVQKARNAHVAGRRDLVDYPPTAFDLSDLPSYKPQQQVSGVIRMTGSNYIADSHVGENWLAAFKKFQPGVTFEFNLKTPSAAVYALFLNAGDVDPSRKMTFEDLLAYERTMNADPVEIEYATGSYDVPGWSPAFGIFVNKANPISKLSIAQLEAIFGAERTGAWEGTSWHPERARTAAQNIRTWGQLGLTGEWADKPIHVYGVNLRYHQAIRFEDQVMHGSAKWNPFLLEYANYGKPDGTLAIGASMMVEDLAKDPYGICYSEENFKVEGAKLVALAAGDSKNYVSLTRENVRNRSYPLYDAVYLYANGSAEKPMDPKVKEFLRFVLSREGQDAIVKDGKYLPLTKEVVDAQLKKIH